MSETENRQAMERYYKALQNSDTTMMGETLHDDYIEEYPQSGEQIKGLDNWRTMMASYPGMPKASNINYRVCGDLGVAEAKLEYPNGQTYYSCSIFEFKDGKIVRARDFFGEPFEAPQWRSRWVEKRAA
ncbi:MAG TPA: nuclear transport factor 2 family protein [Chloroflexota bacterium]